MTVHLPDGKQFREAQKRSQDHGARKQAGLEPKSLHLRFLALHLQALQTWQLNLTLENLIGNFLVVPWLRIHLCNEGEKSESVSSSVVLDFLQPHGLEPGVKALDRTEHACL